MVYKKNYLSDVIFKLHFPVILGLVENAPKEFQDKIIKNFPILEPIQQVQIHIENRGLEFNTERKNRTVWKFKSKDGSANIELDYESLAIIQNKYTDFTTFRELVSTISSIFFTIYPDIVIKRLGLRYINQIKLTEKDFFVWDKYINENFISFLNFVDDKNNLRRILSTIELDNGNDSNLIIKYGIFNSTYPGKITQKEFILDYDCYTNIEFENTKLLEKCDEFHKTIIQNFEKSILDDFRGKLNE